MAALLSSIPALCEHREQGPLMWNNQFGTKSDGGRRSCCCTSFQYESPKCISYNLQLFKCLYFYYFFSLGEEVGNAMMEGRRKGGVKKGSRLPGAYLQSVAPRTFQPWNFTAMKLCFCISVGEDVMLTYLCVLIAPLAAWLTDCLTYWWDDYLTICTLNMFSF